MDLGAGGEVFSGDMLAGVRDFWRKYRPSTVDVGTFHATLVLFYFSWSFFFHPATQWSQCLPFFVAVFAGRPCGRMCCPPLGGEWKTLEAKDGRLGRFGGGKVGLLGGAGIG